MGTGIQSPRRQRVLKTILFDSRIYDEDSIVETAEEFVNFSTFEISVDDHMIEVRLSEIEPDVADKIVDEFSNYVIYKMKKGHTI